MLKKEKKDYVFKRLDALLKPQGYRAFKTGGAPSYVLNKEDIGVSFFLNFLNSGKIDVSELEVSIKMVEEITLEIGHPENVYSIIDNKKYILPTVYDRFEIPGLYRGVGYDIETPDDLETFTNLLIHYLEIEAPKFIKTYTYLPNILKKMDELTAQGRYWQESGYGILFGTLDAQFRGLIISKMCNDQGLGDKIKLCDEIFNKPNYKKWIPYYEKLKERLKTIEPVDHI